MPLTTHKSPSRHKRTMFHESPKTQRHLVCPTFIDVSEKRSELKISDSRFVRNLDKFLITTRLRMSDTAGPALAQAVSCRLIVFNRSAVIHVEFVVDKETLELISVYFNFPLSESLCHYSILLYSCTILAIQSAVKEAILELNLLTPSGFFTFHRV